MTPITIFFALLCHFPHNWSYFLLIEVNFSYALMVLYTLRLSPSYAGYYQYIGHYKARAFLKSLRYFGCFFYRLLFFCE